MLNVKQDISLSKNNLFVRVSIWFIKEIYRKKIKPLLNRKNKTICSFYPHCSEYGILALKKYGFFYGWYKTIRRILKCSKYRHDESCIDYP